MLAKEFTPASVCFEFKSSLQHALAAVARAVARGTYNAKTTFVDDDKKEHLSFEYKLKIAKDWDKEVDLQ